MLALRRGLRRNSLQHSFISDTYNAHSTHVRSNPFVRSDSTLINSPKEDDITKETSSNINSSILSSAFLSRGEYNRVPYWKRIWRWSEIEEDDFVKYSWQVRMISGFSSTTKDDH